MSCRSTLEESIVKVVCSLSIILNMSILLNQIDTVDGARIQKEEYVCCAIYYPASL